jgi:surface antigen
VASISFRTLNSPRTFLIVNLGLAAAMLAAPASSPAGGASLFLRSNTTNADSVGITVAMGGFRYELCRARISEGGRSAAPRAVNTGKFGGAKWTWLVPGNVDRDQWTFSVTCSGGRKVRHASKTFSADGGVGRDSQGLWIPGTMNVRAARIETKSTETGNGGGETSLYPEAQCTWWVARLRPDLPLFPGKSGNALNWAKSAKRAGFPVGVVPAVRAVAVFQPGQYSAGPYGHVAYVTGVKGGKIMISEANFRGRRGHDTRTIESSGLEFIYRKGEMSRAPTIDLLSPLSVAAKSNAPAVRFEAFFFADPSDRHSERTTVIAEDKDSSDGFSAPWNTVAIPNQGGPGGSSVVVSAVALDANGNPTGSRAAARVNVANSRNAGGQTFYPYYVVGTCEEGECGVHERPGPGYTEYPIVGTRQDGEEVNVVCQAYGEEYTSPKASSTKLWDKLTNGNWLIDYYVDTPGRGVPSPPLPPCP